jgi:hypothetical protein
MIPSLLLVVVPVVASAIGLPILDAPRPPDLATTIGQLAGRLAPATAAGLTTSFNSAFLDIARLAYVTCLLVGFMLYFTPRRRLSKDLVIGGVLLVVVSEYVVPAVIAFR